MSLLIPDSCVIFVTLLFFFLLFFVYCRRAGGSGVLGPFGSRISPCGISPSSGFSAPLTPARFTRGILFPFLSYVTSFLASNIAWMWGRGVWFDFILNFLCTLTPYGGNGGGWLVGPGMPAVWGPRRTEESTLVYSMEDVDVGGCKVLFLPLIIVIQPFSLS